jgi:iron complex transport system permease protein
MKAKHIHILLAIITICIIFADLFWGMSNLNNPLFSDIVFTQFRLPRVAAAALAGGSLAISGLIMQTLFRNPLAGPYLIGITPGASFGIAVSLFAQPLFAHLPWFAEIGTLTASILGALFALMIQLILNKGFSSTTRLLLTGMVLSFLFSAGVDLLQNIGNIEQIKQFSLWGMGSFERVKPNEVSYILIPLIVGFAFVLWNRFKLDSYLLGDVYALSAGVNVTRLRRTMIFVGAIMAGWITAFCGPISFVGLIAPHIAKRIYKNESHQKILIPSIIWGTFLCVSADLLAHHLIEGITLQVNAICALIGAPILIVSFRKV